MVDLALRHKIERARTHWLSLVGVEGVAWTAAALGIAALLCFHIDWNWALTAHQRIGCWAMGGALLAACLALLVALPCLRPRPFRLSTPIPIGTSGSRLAGTSRRTRRSPTATRICR